MTSATSPCATTYFHSFGLISVAVPVALGRGPRSTICDGVATGAGVGEDVGTNAGGEGIEMVDGVVGVTRDVVEVQPAPSTHTRRRRRHATGNRRSKCITSSRKPEHTLRVPRLEGKTPSAGSKRRRTCVAAQQSVKVTLTSDRLILMERVTGIEPALSAWEAEVLPLNYTRVAAEAALSCYWTPTSPQYSSNSRTST
jgi:hypothetical protein